MILTVASQHQAIENRQAKKRDKRQVGQLKSSTDTSLKHEIEQTGK